MRSVCNCYGNRKRGYQGCFCNDFEFGAFQRISSKLVVGSSGYCQWFPCVLFGASCVGICVLGLLTPTLPLSLQGGRAQGARVFYRALRILRIVCALAVCNVCILQSMRTVHIQCGPVRIYLGRVGAPYTHYLSTNGAPTNPHITGLQLKYVILALCSIYVTYPLYIVSRLYLPCAKHTFSSVTFKWYTSPLLQAYWGTWCVLCSFAFAHLCYTYVLFGNNCTILVL